MNKLNTDMQKITLIVEEPAREVGKKIASI